MPVIIDCVQKIRENNSVILALKIINNPLKNFPLHSDSAGPISKNEAIEVLVNQHMFLETFFKNLANFKDICLQIACNAGEDITNLMVVERVKYKEEVKVRLSLLQTLVEATKLI